MSEEIIVGKNPVLEALKSGHTIQKIWVSKQLKNQTMQKLKTEAQKNNTIVQIVPLQKLDSITKENHQGIVAFVSAYEYADIETLFSRAEEKGEQPFFIILDELEDPHNLGSILRSADATGVHGIIIPKRRAVGLTSTVAKTSSGAIEHVPVVRVTNISQVITELQERGMWVVGTAFEDSSDYRTLDGDTALAIVIGNEGKGISKLVRKKCDWTISLPMLGEVTSLNASVAGGLLMYEVYRKRHPFEGQS